MIWEWKARSVEQARQRRVVGWARERRRPEVEGLGEAEEVREAGEVERDGTVLAGEVGEGGSEVRRRKGMRREGRR